MAQIPTRMNNKSRRVRFEKYFDIKSFTSLMAALMIIKYLAGILVISNMIFYGLCQWLLYLNFLRRLQKKSPLMGTEMKKRLSS